MTNEKRDLEAKLEGENTFYAWTSVASIFLGGYLGVQTSKYFGLSGTEAFGAMLGQIYLIGGCITSLCGGLYEDNLKKLAELKKD